MASLRLGSLRMGSLRMASSDWFMTLTRMILVLMSPFNDVVGVRMGSLRLIHDPSMTLVFMLPSDTCGTHG